MKVKFSQALLEELKRRGITRVFGVPGRENAEILFNEVSGIQFVTTRIELTAGVMAGFAGKITVKPQVCFCTMGPGATNMVTAIAWARLNYSPIILISAQVETDFRHHNITHQCVDQRSIIAPVAKWSHEFNQADELPEVIDRAFRVAMTEPLGPVHLSIPCDLFRQEIVSSNNEEKIELNVSYDTPPSPLEAIQAIREVITKSRYPICLVGQEVVRSGAEELVASFCREWKIPLLSSANAKGILPVDDILNYGAASSYMEGIFRHPGLLEDIFAPVDLVINIGYQYVDDLRPDMWSYGKKKQVIHISSVSYTQIISSKYKPDYEVLGDIKHTLKVLSLDVETPKQPPIVSKLQERYNEIYYPRNPVNDTHLNLLQIIKCINEHLDEGILIADIGYYRHHAVLFSRVERTKQFFTDSGLATFGSGLPSAAAAQLIYPNKKVFLLCGDGGFHSGSGDLETLARYQLPIIIILINNSSFGLIELYQKKGTQGKSDHKEILSFTNVDFAKLAEANNCVGVRAEKVDEIADAIRHQNRKKPLLIEVLLDYCSDAKLTPPY